MSYTATAFDGVTPVSSCPAVGATSCVIPNLLNDRTYTVRVVAKNTVGTSPPSEASAPVVPAAYPGSPGAPALGKPTSVVAAAGNTKVVVSWDRPAHDGGVQITSYTATANSGGGTCSATGGATSCVVEGLANGTPYTFTVVPNGTPGAVSDPSGPAIPFTYVRTSAATAAPPAAEPWIGGQYIDLTNSSGTVARLGGYGLWNALSSRFNNNGSLENRAAFLFAPTEAARPPVKLYGSTSSSCPYVHGADRGRLQGGLAGASMALVSDTRLR